MSYNCTYRILPTVYTVGTQEGANYITRTPKPYVRLTPYICGL